MGTLAWLKQRLVAYPALWPVIGAVGAVAAALAGVQLVSDLVLFGQFRQTGPALALAVVLALALVYIWLARRPLAEVMAAFVVAVVMTAYVLVSVRIAGLNLRLSQLFLPLVVLRLWAVGAFWRAAPSRVWLAAAGLMLWASFLAWTVIQLPNLPEPVVALGRVMLLGLNLLHAVLMYLLVVRTGQWRLAARAFAYSVLALNGMLVLLAVGAALGVPGIRLGTTLQPTLAGGGLVPRFSVGVMSGVLSACVLAFPVADWARGKGLTPQRLAWALIAIVGMVVGFSRQNLVSLAGVVGLIGADQFLRGRVRRMLRLVLVVALVAGSGFWLASQLTITQAFFQAFAGRALLLFNARAYETGSVNDRFILWSRMLQDVAANPLVGQGQDAYLRHFPTQGQGSHNFPIEILHAAGLWGLVPYLLIHGVVVGDALRVLRRRGLPPDDRALLLACLAAFVALVLSSLTNLIFSNPIYWIVMGLLAGAARTLDRAHPPAAHGTPAA
jgi:hypothetical protein